MIGQQEKTLFKETLNVIKNNPKHWNQRHWHCETSHCFEGLVEIMILNMDLDTKIGSIRTKKIAIEALGINNLVAEILFAPTNSLENLEECCNFACLSKEQITTLDFDELEIWEKIFLTVMDIPPLTLIKLSKHYEQSIRLAIAEHPNITIEILSDLAQDENLDVRYQAKELLKKLFITEKQIARLCNR